MISIIMPLYNAEKYLEEALQSILNQTYKKFELICINDASNDATLKILCQFQKKDNRIRILENYMRIGAAESRNRGIKEARGKYIIFLDGDDIFEDELLALTYKEIERHDVDVVMYEYKHVTSEHIYEKKSIQRSRKFVERYCKRPFSVKECEAMEIVQWSTSPCNKLYKRSFIEDNELKFQSLSSSNDIYFVEMALLLSDKIIMLNDRRVMLYARDHNVTTRISYDRDPMCSYYAVKEIGNELIRRNVFYQVREHYYFFSLFCLRAALLATKKEETAKNFYMFLSEEGIDNLADMCKESYQLNQYISDMMNNYKTQSFCSGWYKKEDIVCYYLEKNIQNVTDVFQTYKKNNIKIALWGAGTKGLAILSFFNKYNLKVDEVVDIDSNKQGSMIENYQIRNPDDILPYVQVVIASNYDIYIQVNERLTGSMIKVIDLEELIGL